MNAPKLNSLFRNQNGPTLLAHNRKSPVGSNNMIRMAYGRDSRGNPFSLLNDRIYIKLAEMAESSPYNLPPIYVEGDRTATLVLFWLVVTHVVLYFLLAFIMPDVGRRHFSITQENLVSGRWYVILTHALNHTSVLHMLINTYVLMSMAPPLLAYLGLRNVAAIYLASCFVGGSVASMQLMKPETLNNIGSGSSTGLFGLFATYSVLFPNASAGFVFLPFQFRMQNLFLAVIAFEVARFLMVGDVSAGGHLGGALGGVAMTAMLRR
eukprot:CAMPEP_0117449764 /NCGR_PEP_ID=MMETSP0759-20121206/8112_1 /TAXON_ID=63605 /ORGANISM="Percolomonas cosmopolitus, Strain WS" /LENGTH=265 /DNA_ID=CAMNT_0005242247 /DNA_START=186 /DNA_END=983 /DNA_ORIENTATION=+